jgi:hypothetical protein
MILFSDMTQWKVLQDMLNLDDSKHAMPNTLQQVFPNTSGMPSNIDLQREDPVRNVERHGLQLVLPPKSDSRRVATEGGHVFRCTQCGKVYMSKGSLTRHIKFMCRKEPQLQCPHCPVKRKCDTSLLTHIYCKHPETLN